MYFPFLELQKWRKRSAEIRRRNCAVLPYICGRSGYGRTCRFHRKKRCAKLIITIYI